MIKQKQVFKKVSSDDYLTNMNAVYVMEATALLQIDTLQLLMHRNCVAC